MMSYNKFKILRLFVVIVAGFLAAWAAYNGYAWIPAPALIAAIIILLLFRRGLREITVDERTFSIAYKASRVAFVAFGVGAVAIGATLLALGQSGQPELKPVGFTLCYSICALVIIYSVAYSVYNRKFGGQA
jgi:uncharacterized membrane protein